MLCAVMRACTHDDEVQMHSVLSCLIMSLSWTGALLQSHMQCDITLCCTHCATWVLLRNAHFKNL